jgi:hypothetical protein
MVEAHAAAAYRFLCDTGVKWGNGEPTVDALYKLEQAESPLLAGKGADLTHVDIEALR